MFDDAQTIIARLDLTPHPEGGHYRETWRAAETVPGAALPTRFAGGPRPVATAIYFLLQAGEFSALHRIASDELWFYHAGAPLEVISLDPVGRGATVAHIGLAPGATPSHIVPAGHTFGARVAGDGAWALVSCVVAPGFDFRDFAMPSRAALLAEFPEHAALVTALTRPA